MKKVFLMVSFCGVFAGLLSMEQKPEIDQKALDELRLKKRTIILTHVAPGSLREALLKQDKAVEPIYNLFLITVHKDVDIKDEKIKNWDLTKKEKKAYFWQVERDRLMEKHMKWICSCIKWSQVVHYECGEVMQNIGYDLEQRCKETRLMYDAIIKTKCYKDDLIEKLQELKAEKNFTEPEIMLVENQEEMKEEVISEEAPEKPTLEREKQEEDLNNQDSK